MLVSGVEFYSFDIFDTLMTRITATPHGIFALLQAELVQNTDYAYFPEFVRNNFYNLRVNAESLARNNADAIGNEEVTLKQIYEAIGTTGTVSEQELKGLMELEISLENRSALLIPENINRMKALIERESRVVLISDMYLGEEVIRKILVGLDPVFTDIKIYVSCDSGKTKRTGSLYKKVHDDEGVEYGQWVHIGDNISSDINTAQRFGIRTEHFLYEPIKSYEKTVLKDQQSDPFSQLTIGASRNARLFHALKEASAFGCTVGGPMFFPYVWWILDKSAEMRIRDLYFVARDGYVLKKMADIIIAHERMDIKTHYIYGSRKTWRLPPLSPESFDIAQMLQVSQLNNITKIYEFADLFQITYEELMPFLPEEYRYSDMSLGYADVARIQKVLEDNHDFKTHVLQLNKQKRNRAVYYLKQELNLSEDAFAFVELHGSGYTQACLSELMREFYDKPVRSFFFHLYRTNTYPNTVLYNYLPGALYLDHIVETLCRAPHGQALDYVERGGIMVPVCSEEETEVLLRHGFNEYTEGIVKFTETYLESLSKYPVNSESMSLLLKYFYFITRTPDVETMDFIGDMPHDTTGRSGQITVFAPILTTRDIRNIYLLRSNEPVEAFYHGSSLPYSELRCSPKDKKRIAFYTANHDKLYGKMMRLPKWIRGGFRTQTSDYVLPAASVRKGDRVVLYGAGNVGQSFYKQLRKTGCKVVLWADRWYADYRKRGFPVSDPDRIRDAKFDYVLIAVLDRAVAEDINKAIIGLDVSAEKIVWIKP